MVAQRGGSAIEGGANRQSAALEDVGVNHGGLHVFVTEEFLDGADVVAVLEEVGGKGVAEGVGGDGFLEACGFSGGANGFLEDAFVYVVAHGFAGGGVHREGDGGEEVLPGKFFGSVGVFPDQGVGQVDFAAAFSEILLMDEGDDFDLFLEGWYEGIRQDGDAVVFPFSIADEDGVVAKINVFDAQAETLCAA